MMFNEYMEHSNQCAGYYSVTRKEEVNIQQTDTNRFRQKWLESSGGINYPTPPQNSTPPLAQSQFNNINNNSNTTGANRPIKKEHHPQQHVHGYMGQVSNNGSYPNNGPNQYKQNGGAFNPEQQQHMMKQQHIQQQQHGQMQYQQQQQHQQSKYYEPQFIPNMKDNSKQQNPPQPQQHTRQSPSPMILSNNPNINNSNNPGNFANQQAPTNKFGMHPNNTNNSVNSNPNTVNSNNNKINGHANNPNIKMEPHNYANNSNGQQQKIFHHNPSMMHQGNTYPSQGLPGHPNMHQNNNFKQPFQQPAQHQQMYHQQAYNVQVQKPHQPQLPPPQQQQQQQHQQHQYSLDLKAAPRVNSPQIHSPYPQIHSNSGITETNSPKETWSDANKRDLVSPSLASSNSFSKKISSSSLVQQQHSELPIKSPAPPGSIEPKTLNDIQVSASPVRMMTQSPSNSSLNTSICVPTPLNIQQNLIDFNQDQLIADDCDSSNLLSPLNNIQKASSINNNSDQIMSASTNHHGCQNTKSSILSEINIDELFLYYPKVFEEFFFSFKLNSIEQIEHDLRTYCEQQFKLNFTNKSSSTGSNSTQQFSIRI